MSISNAFRNKYLFAGCILVIMIGCKPLFKKSNIEKSQKKYDFSAIENKIQTWIDSSYYSGTAMMVVKNDSIVYKKCYGNYTQDTQVFIASAGKWLAAATIAAVVERTNLSWDDKVNKWLPEFKDSKGEATLRQLFSHTAGFPNYQPKDSVTDNYQTLKESVKHIVGLPATNKPGERFSYGGLAMQVAGRMAKLAAGKDFESLFLENIAFPLGMKNTHFVPVNDQGGHSPMLGGGARSTLTDYMHFLEMIAHDGKHQGKQILSKMSILEMQADQVKSAFVDNDEYVEHVRAEKHKSIYGLGEWREELDEKDNAILISSPSWAGAYPWIDKTTNTYGFFIAHVNVVKANKEGFSSFYSSPVLAIMVRDVYKKPALPK